VTSKARLARIQRIAAWSLNMNPFLKYILNVAMNSQIALMAMKAGGTH
jgi:hypothetical protein